MTSSTDNDWCLIESDPAVFTELLENLQCPSLELYELFSLDDDCLADLQQRTAKIYGLIFLFEYIADREAAAASNAPKKQPLQESETPDSLFFAHQVTTNACATQALLSIVLNAGLNEDVLGPVLAQFHQFTSSFSPAVKGLSIAGSRELQQAHNAFSKPDSFWNDQRKAKPDEPGEAFHFVAYVPKEDHVYELDGLQTGPIDVGKVETSTEDSLLPPWLLLARTAIQERMQAAAASSVKFNCMAVIHDQRLVEGADLAALNQTRLQGKLENQRRRHDYVPAAVEVLKTLAVKGELKELVAAARERQMKKVAMARSKK